MVQDHHVNIHHKDKDGWTALHNACSRGHSKIVRFLVERGARVDVRSKMGHTPLSMYNFVCCLNEIQHIDFLLFSKRCFKRIHVDC